MKNHKKEKFPLSVIPSAGDCAMESFFCVATIAFLGGIIVFIKWIWVSDSHTAWIHVKPWWYLLMRLALPKGMILLNLQGAEAW